MVIQLCDAYRVDSSTSTTLVLISLWPDQEGKKANVSVRMVWISFGALPCRKKEKPYDNSRFDVVEIARVSWHASELFSFPVGQRTYQHHAVFVCVYIHIDKTVPLQAWTAPEFSRNLRLICFKTIGIWGWQTVPAKQSEAQREDLTRGWTALEAGLDNSDTILHRNITHNSSKFWD